MSFTNIGDEEAPDAICIFCHTRLANTSLVPAKLQRHTETRHSDYRDKDKSFWFFERKPESFNKIGNAMAKICRIDNEKATEAIHYISLHGEAHTIGEPLIKTYIKRCSFMCI